MWAYSKLLLLVLEYLCNSEPDIIMAIDLLRLKIIGLDFQLAELAEFQQCPFTPNGSLLIQGLICSLMNTFSSHLPNGSFKGSDVSSMVRTHHTQELS